MVAESPITFIPKGYNQYELWAPVKGYENYYSISSMGRLFDINNGFFCVSFRYKDEKYLFYPQIDQYVHIAMMRSFNYFPGCEGYSVRHKDGCTLSNYLDNLEWSDKYISAAYDENRGSNCYLATYDENAIREVCRLLEKDIYTTNEICKMTGVNPRVINGVKYGQSWRHISKDYNFNVDAKAHRTIKYPDELVEQICRDLENDKYLPICDICNKYNIPKSVVQSIASGNTRTDISSKYDLGNPEDRNFNLRNKAKKDKARELLRNTNMRIAEIAIECDLSKEIIYTLNSKEKIRALVPSNQYITNNKNI